MNSTKDVELNFEQGKIIFKGRTEQLDWKKIASIDIDNLIHDGDTSQLLDLIKPVTFCKADTEFDDGRIRIDPAFIKVFRISQLISEFLLSSQEKGIERLTNLQKKYNETGKEKEKLSEEILHLKETLTSAKKELKKRKEMLASTQSEMLGENNNDEYDQCPYCSKKFLRPGYLLAHIQRRHQGLPANPLYTSYPPGAATIVCHHPHPSSLPHTSHQLHNHHQQTPRNGIYDSSITLPQTPQHGQPMMNHALFPSVHTPSPSMLYGSNHQHVPSNLSFSGSITSLNNIAANNLGNSAIYTNYNVNGMGKRESFTQTAINEKSSSHLDLLQEETPNVFSEKGATHQQEQQHDSCHSSDKHSPDSLNQQLVNTGTINPPTQMETLMRPRLSSPPSPSFKLVDGSRSHPPANVDHGSGDAVVKMVDTSTLINRELVEAEKLNVFRMQNPYETHWRNLEDEKVAQNGTEDAMIFETSDTKEPTRFSINSYQSHLREEGEVTKSPADEVNVNHPQFGGDQEKGGKDFEELKRLLQVSVQGELKSLILRLESQEHFWQDKLASLQQDHERQIQQLRQEVRIQNGTTRRNNDGTQAVAANENEVVIVNDEFQVEREIGEDEESIVDENKRGVLLPPSGIILVESRKGQPNPNSSKHKPFKATCDGAPRDTLDDEETIGVPIAKPRTSKVVAALTRVPAAHETHSYSGTGQMSSAAPSPIPTRGNVHHHPITQHHHLQHDHSSSGELMQLESYSESDPEFLTVIQPEEFHEVKHDNSIVPNSSDTGTVAVNNKRSQRQYQHPLSSHTTRGKSGLVAEMNKSGSRRRAEEEMAVTDVVKSDEVSDYTLSESVDDDVEQDNGICSMSPPKKDRKYQEQHQQNHHRHLGFGDHPGGKSSVKQTPVKKKYIFDADARKLVEVSPDDDDDDDEEQSDNNDDLNNASSADDYTEGKKGKSQSQLDLVRAKTIMELERNIADIGLNPESTAIGMEEMKRALRHLKLKRQDSKDQIHNYDKFDEERNAVKTFTKFEATKSNIDGKLDAMSQSSKKSQQSSLKKILTAVKSSGKNFRKRVASAVKKKHKSEQFSGDEKGGSDVEKRKRKPSSAPHMKTTFFSKARWTKKKNSEGGTTKKSSETAAGDKKADEEEESISDMSSSEESEEVELPPFMKRTNTSLSLHRRGSSSRSRSSERQSRNTSQHNSTRSGIQRSRSRSAKPLKRLSSLPKSSPSHLPSSGVIAAARKSSDSSPFSNVDEYDDDKDNNEHDDDKRGGMYENISSIRDSEKAERVGSHSSSNKIQGHNERQKENKDSIKRLLRQQNPQENSSDDDYGDVLKPKTTATKKKTGTQASQEDRKRVEDSMSSENQSEDDWDDDEDEPSFATSNEILVNAKSSGVLTVKGNMHAYENNDHLERAGTLTQQRHSSGKVNTIMREGKKWNHEEMADTRLQQIRQYVSKSKKEVSRDETSLSEEDSEEDYAGREDPDDKKIKQYVHYIESKPKSPRERKIGVVERTTPDFQSASFSPGENTNQVQHQKWATSTEPEKRGRQQLLQSLDSNASSPYGPVPTDHTNSYQQDKISSSNTKFSEFSKMGTNSSTARMMQPTNHPHLSAGLGTLANLKNRAETQIKLLQDGGRASPSSRNNSWDSQKKEISFNDV